MTDNRLVRALRTVLLAIAVTGATIAAAGAQIETRAEYAVLMDGETGAVLFDKNADDEMAPASMSKMMTMVLVFEALKAGELKLTDEFLVTKNAFEMGGSRMFAKLGSSVPVEALIHGVVVQSGNDACVVLAEGLSGTEDAFAAEMTARARELGLKKSYFANSTGWPHPDNVVTARELALIARHTIYNLSEYYHYYAAESFEWNNIKQYNRNPLLFQNVGADGLKTGHTEESGYGLTASAERAGRRLILVINGLQSANARAEEARKLLDWGFRSFRRYTVFEENREIGTARVWGGEQSTVPLVADGPVALLLTRLDRKKLRAEIVYEGPLRAPIKKGAQVARLRVYADDKPVNELPLYAGADVAEGGIIGQAFDTLKFMVIGG